MQKKPTSTALWTSEKVFHLGDPYYDEICLEIDNSTASIDIEIYIFADDALGQRIGDRLIAASKRGVAVRVVVDGIGSLGWEKVFGAKFSEAGINFKVYHQLFWERYALQTNTEPFFKSWFKAFGQINKRTHRKLVIIDKKIAFIGSRNFASCHSEKLSGTRSWRDISVRLEGEAVGDLIYAFNRTWAMAPPRREWRKILEKKRTSFSPLVRLNFSRKIRRRSLGELLSNIESAKKRVWIVGSYFIPFPSLLQAFRSAAERGVDVRILVPSRSDIFFMPWLTRTLYHALLKRGIKIYEFLPAILHTKAILVDDWMVIGSTNFNYRSFMHDLEADVVLVSPESRSSLEGKFLEYLADSKEVLNPGGYNRGWIESGLGHLALMNIVGKDTQHTFNTSI